MTRRDLYAIAAINIFGGTFFGLMLGTTNPLYTFKYGEGAWTDGLQKAMWSVAFLFGASPVSLFAGFVADRVGRLRTIRAVLPFSLIGTLFSLFVPYAAAASSPKGFWLAMVGRIISGGGVGLAVTLCPLYTEETSPRSHSAMFGNFFQIFVTNGILLAAGVAMLLTGLIREEVVVSTLTGAQAGRDAVLWALPVLAAAALHSATFLAPESPKDVADSARVVGTSTVVGDHAVEEPDADLQLLERRGMPWKALVLALALGAASQLTGINAITFFSPDVLSFLEPAYANLLFSFINFVAAAAALPINRRLPPRPVYITTLLVLSASALWMGGWQAIPHVSRAVRSAMMVIGLVVFLGAFEIGVGSLFFVLAASIFPKRCRATGCAITNLAQLILTMVVPYVFSTLISAGVDQAYLWAAFGGFGLLLAPPIIALLPRDGKPIE